MGHRCHGVQSLWCEAVLSDVIDLYNGEVIGYTLSLHPDLMMVTEMIKRVVRRAKGAKPILHSDRGCCLSEDIEGSRHHTEHVAQGKLSGQCRDRKFLRNPEIGVVLFTEILLPGTVSEGDARLYKLLQQRPHQAKTKSNESGQIPNSLQ